MFFFGQFASSSLNMRAYQKPLKGLIRIAKGRLHALDNFTGLDDPLQLLDD